MFKPKSKFSKHHALLLSSALFITPVLDAKEKAVHTTHASQVKQFDQDLKSLNALNIIEAEKITKLSKQSAYGVENAKVLKQRQEKLHKLTKLAANIKLSDAEKKQVEKMKPINKKETDEHIDALNQLDIVKVNGLKKHPPTSDYGITSSKKNKERAIKLSKLVSLAKGL